MIIWKRKLPASSEAEGMKIPRNRLDREIPFFTFYRVYYAYVQQVFIARIILADTHFEQHKNKRSLSHAPSGPRRARVLVNFSVPRVADHGRANFPQSSSRCLLVSFRSVPTLIQYLLRCPINSVGNLVSIIRERTRLFTFKCDRKGSR